MNGAAGHPHEEEALGRAYDARLMRRLLRYLRPYRRRVALAVALLLAGAGLQLAGPWLTRLALDHAIPQHDTRLLALLAAAFAATLLLTFALEYAREVLTTAIGQHVIYDLRREIFGHLQRLDIAFFDRNPVGRLMTRVTNDVETLNELFGAGVVTVFGDLFTLTAILAAMLLMDGQLALATFSVLPAVAAIVFFFRGRMRDASREIRARLARLNAFLQERLSGIAVIRLFAAEEETARRFRTIDRDYLHAHLRSVTYYALFFPIIELLGAAALALVIVYGGAGVLHGHVSVGVVAAFLQYVRRFFQPIQDLSDKYNMLQGAMAAAERIFSLLDTPAPPATRAPAIVRHRPARGELEFDDVWFAYPPRDGSPPAAEPAWALRGVRFRIRPGERVALVGHTGAGKTTLASLLLRFYEPQRGEIRLDGTPIRDIPPAELRRQIGLVLQDVFLFSRDIAYNIRLGRDDIDDARLREAARRVGADRFIERLPAGYRTPLGERGASLSAGERQLLAFARALAFDPAVLVLDEATSAVDAELEARIEHAVRTLLHNRTALVIAHRLSTVQSADRILVLHHGELREEGTHAELLARGGLYARLYELQFAPPATARATGTDQ